MKVAIVANTCWHILNFRMNLIRAIQQAGCEVIAISPRDEYVERLESLGVRWAEWKVTRSSINPLSEVSALWNLRQVYAAEKLDLVHHYTIKPVLYGTVAAKLAGVPAVVNSVTGLPYFVLSKDSGLVRRTARWLALKWYAWSLTGRGVRSIFQNYEDLHELIRFAPELEDTAAVTGGSGVDLSRFIPQPREEEIEGSRVRVLFIGRLIREKGIYEFVEAANALRDTDVPLEFLVCGEPDAGNRSSVPPETFAEWEKQGTVQFQGHVDNILPVMDSADLVVLPSYREGAPRSLIEAAAMAKPVVSTDVPGCRHVVKDGVTGVLVPSRDSKALAGAILELARDPQRRAELGRAGRERAETYFDERDVLSRTLEVYASLNPEFQPQPVGAESESADEPVDELRSPLAYEVGPAR